MSSYVTLQMDISSLTATTLASFRADLWLLSPACQPYTVLNPNAKGEFDPRAASFLHLIKDVLPELAAKTAHPSRLFVENVAGFEVLWSSICLSAVFDIKNSCLVRFHPWRPQAHDRSCYRPSGLSDTQP